MLLARAGWRTLNVALEELPSLPTNPPTQDLQSEPFWRMNKYFTQHQVAVLGLCRLVCPSPRLYEMPPLQDGLCFLSPLKLCTCMRWWLHPGQGRNPQEVGPLGRDCGLPGQSKFSNRLLCSKSFQSPFFQPPFQRQARDRARLTWPGSCNSWQVYSPCERPSWGEVQAAGLGIHLPIAQVCSAVFTR